MRLRSCVLLLMLGSSVSAQEVNPITTIPEPTVFASPESTGTWQTAISSDGHSAHEREPLASNRDFSNFIGFMSNPLQNIDPRSLTQIQPIFLSGWVHADPALPNVDGQVYGPAISVALTDRLSVGINQGGYAHLDIDRNDRRAPLLNLLAATRGQEFGGDRDGFLNVGGFAQYTLIADVEKQFLATAGLRYVLPIGSYEVFQGKGPALLAPYLTVGKEFCNFHFLATTGYQFPARTGDRDTELFYLNAHLDYQLFGWIYPLVEANWTNHTTDVSLTLPTRHSLIDLGNFEASGNVATISAGVNLVLVRDRLEFGAAYTRAVGTQHDVDINAMIVKMVLRY
jgi:hypothetical protein